MNIFFSEKFSATYLPYLDCLPMDHPQLVQEVKVRKILRFTFCFAQLGRLSIFKIMGGEKLFHN